MMKDRKTKGFLSVSILAISLCIALTGCGGNTTSEQNDVIDDIEQAKTKIERESKNDKNSSESEFMVLSDDKKYIITMGDEYCVLYHDGDAITGMEVYLECETKEEAKSTYESIKDAPEAIDGAEKVSYSGKYVIATYSTEYVKEQFGTASLEELKAMFDMFSVTE